MSMDLRQAQRQAFYRYLMRGPAGISSDDAQLLHEKRGVTGTSGLAPESWSEIIGDGFDTNYLISRCSRVTVANNVLSVTRYTENTETANRITYKEEGTRNDLAGAAFALPRFTVSGAAPNDYNYNYESTPITLHEVGVNVTVSKELIEEASYSMSVEQMLVELLGKKLTSEIERQIVAGRAPAQTVANRRECQGLVFYSQHTSQIVEDGGAAAPNHILYSTLATACEKLRASSWKEAIWLFGTGSIYGMVHTDATAASIHAPDYETPEAFAKILGRPALFTPHFSHSASGDILAFLVNLKAYVLAMHRDGLQVERLNEVAAATGQVVLRASVRVGGNIIDDKSLIQVVSN
jgi:HK97 family phage major capsid protein